MTAPNEIVVLISAPLALMFVLLALYVRRYGALHWVFAIGASWLAGVADDLGAGFQPLAVALVRPAVEGGIGIEQFPVGARTGNDQATSATNDHAKEFSASSTGRPHWIRRGVALLGPSMA